MIAEPDKAVRWWQALQPDPPRNPGDRAALARLRRAGRVGDAMMDPAVMALFRQVGADHPGDLPDIALLAAVLAHVREDVRGAAAARLVGPDRPEAPETARMSPLRFRRLLDAATPDERLIAFRRMVALADGALPVRDLALSLLRWNDRCRQRWTYDYWDAGRRTEASPTPAEEPAA
jgi:CRISPR system Cascade subunit CasB